MMPERSYVRGLQFMTRTHPESIVMMAPVLGFVRGWIQETINELQDKQKQL
jgi:hypothetical protein